MLMSITLEMAGQLQVSDRTLRRAVSRKLLRGERISANKLVISAAERDYARTHWTLLQALVRALRTEPGVRTAVLFGSVAKGSDRADSDVDIAVDLRPKASTWVPALERRLSRAAGRRVHVIRLSDVLADESFAVEVVDHGRPLVDRGEAWQALRGRRAHLERAAAARKVTREQEMAGAWERLVQAA